MFLVIYFHTELEPIKHVVDYCLCFTFDIEAFVNGKHVTSISDPKFWMLSNAMFSRICIATSVSNPDIGDHIDAPFIYS